MFWFSHHPVILAEGFCGGYPIAGCFYHASITGSLTYPLPLFSHDNISPIINPISRLVSDDRMGVFCMIFEDIICMSRLNILIFRHSWQLFHLLLLLLSKIIYLCIIELLKYECYRNYTEYLSQAGWKKNSRCRADLSFIIRCNDIVFLCFLFIKNRRKN